MFDFLFHLLLPETKFGLALWGLVFLVLGLVAAASVLGWSILT